MPWRVRNVPVPEPFVAGLVLGTGLHWVRPLSSPIAGPLGTAVGAAAVAVGIAVVGWAVLAAGRRSVADPDTLVTEGPYRFSRNPMYVGWAVGYVGVALLVGTGWPLALLPLVAVGVHVAVRREERTLERAFGAEYRDYVASVRRYL